MFKDKVYENLDDLSKMVEPFEFSMYDEINQLPDLIEIDFNKFTLSDLQYGLRAVDIFKLYAVNNNLKYCSQFYGYLNNIYQFESTESSIDFDVKNRTASEKISLKRDPNFIFDDKCVYKIIRHMVQDRIHQIRYRYSKYPFLTEYCELFNIECSRIKANNKYEVFNSLSKQISDNICDLKLNIKDISLLEKFLYWSALYITEGNLAALNNLAKIKIMSHDNKAIYSIEEKEVQ